MPRGLFLQDIDKYVACCAACAGRAVRVSRNCPEPGMEIFIHASEEPTNLKIALVRLTHSRRFKPSQKLGQKLVYIDRHYFITRDDRSVMTQRYRLILEYFVVCDGIDN